MFQNLFKRSLEIFEARLRWFPDAVRRVPAVLRRDDFIRFIDELSTEGTTEQIRGFLSFAVVMDGIGAYNAIDTVCFAGVGFSCRIKE
jgi:hypothetical protein